MTTANHNDSKYIVFKRIDYLKAVEQACLDAGHGVEPDILPLPDAVVIRLQDAFAASALDAYANSISVAIAILRAHKTLDAAPEIEQLQKIADYFHNAANISHDMAGKIPT
jgi:phage tail protein X